MMSEPLAKAYNDQISMEFASSHAYLQLAAYFADESLTGFESWMRLQAEEERMHALKFFDFVLDRGNQVVLGSIDAPTKLPSSALEAFEIALGHEQRVTAAIRDLFALAESEGRCRVIPDPAVVPRGAGRGGILGGGDRRSAPIRRRQSGSDPDARSRARRAYFRRLTELY